MPCGSRCENWVWLSTETGAVPRRRRLRVALALIVFCAILAFGLSPVPAPQWFAHQDKVHHFLGFAALAISMRLALPNVATGRLLLACVALAALVEVGQGVLLAARTASFADWLASALGAIAGAFILWLLRRHNGAG